VALGDSIRIAKKWTGVGRAIPKDPEQKQRRAARGWRPIRGGGGRYHAFDPQAVTRVRPSAVVLGASAHLSVRAEDDQEASERACLRCNDFRGWAGVR
jgi:hypothetical protein